MTFGMEPRQDGLHDGFVGGVRVVRTKIVVGQAEFAGEIPPTGRRGCRSSPRILSLRLGGAAGAFWPCHRGRSEKKLLPRLAARAGDDIGDDFLVSVDPNAARH